MYDHNEEMRKLEVTERSAKLEADRLRTNLAIEAAAADGNNSRSIFFREKTAEFLTKHLGPVVDKIGTGIATIMAFAASEAEKEREHELALIAADPAYALKRLEVTASSNAKALDLLAKGLEEGVRAIEKASERAHSISERRLPFEQLRAEAEAKNAATSEVTAALNREKFRAEQEREARRNGGTASAAAAKSS